MTTAKQSVQYKSQVPDGQATVFYIDIRSAGLGYDEVVQKAMAEHGVLYLRGKVSKIFSQDGKVVVWGADTLAGVAVEVHADLVVLQAPLIPRSDVTEVARRLRLSQSADGFLAEAHVKLRPVETYTAGVFLAGTVQAPRDIPETLSQASSRGSRQGAGPVRATEAGARPSDCPGQLPAVRRMRCVHEGLPVRRPEHRRLGARRGCESGAVPILWRVCGCLPEQGLATDQRPPGPGAGDAGRGNGLGVASMTAALDYSPPLRRSFLSEVDALSGQYVELCYHCHTCSAGCLVSEAMAYGPDRVLRLIELGDRAGHVGRAATSGCVSAVRRAALAARTGIDVARVMDTLRHLSLAHSATRETRRLRLFHDIYMQVVRYTGRSSEAVMLGLYKVLGLDLFSDLGAGLQLVLRGKIPIIPERIARSSNRSRGSLPKRGRRTWPNRRRHERGRLGLP